VSEEELAACVQELEANLNAEAALYEQLREIARETELAARREDNEAVGELMKSKNGVIDELRRVSGTTDRLRQDFAGYRDVPIEIQAKVSEALGRTEALLEEVLEFERGIEEPLRSMKDSIRAELHEAVRGRRLLNGYRQAPVTEPRFMDKRQ
jgi:SMC interacting uncharacterized protein involved in chromosome segregation